MPQILAPYSPYDGLGGLVKALSNAAGLNIDLDNTNIDRNQAAIAQAPSVPENQPLVHPTCTRHPACRREAGHSGRCRLKAAIQTKDILPDAFGHRQCPYEKDCVNEAGHRGRCKIRPQAAAAAAVTANTQTPAQPSPTATRQDEEEEEESEDTEEDSGTTVDKCQRNVGCVKEAGHVGRCSGLSKNPPRKQVSKLVGAAVRSALPIPPRKRKPPVTLEEYATSESEDEQEEEEEKDVEESEDSEEESASEDEEENVDDDEAEKVATDVEDIQIPKWPARKRPRGRISGVHSDRKELPKTSQQRKSLGSGTGGRRGGGGGGRGGRGGGARGRGRASSAAPALPTAEPVAAAPAPVVNMNETLLARAVTTPPAAAAAATATGTSLVQQCRALEAALEICGVTAYDRLSYSMKFAALPTEVREAQWDALQRHIDGGNVEGVVAAVRAQARGGGAGY